MVQTPQWDWEIAPRARRINWNPGWLWQYCHLLSSLVHRDFLLNYRQTVLGPAWIIFQPLLTLATYLLVFGKLIGLGTGGDLPPVLFYFSGIVLWSFFSEAFLAATQTFRDHYYLFSKVYFPRIIMPMAQLGTHAIRMGVQLLLLLVLMAYYIVTGTYIPKPGAAILLVPASIIALGLLAFSAGLVFAVLTAKYRDLMNLVHIGIRLLLFVTPVIYPLSIIGDDYAWILQLNPLTPWFEAFRIGLLGSGALPVPALLGSAAFIVCLFFFSVNLFNKMGSRLMDHV